LGYGKKLRDESAKRPKKDSFKLSLKRLKMFKARSVHISSPLSIYTKSKQRITSPIPKFKNRGMPVPRYTLIDLSPETNKKRND
jgi:hypothetical protein